MKKTIIAGAAASVLAAMPIAGVFADNAQFESVTDNVNLVVSDSCMITADAEEYTVDFGEVSTGAIRTQKGAVMTLNCNSESGWHLTAAGAGEAGHETALYNESGTSGKNEIATGIATTGTTSTWAFKIDGVDGGNNIVDTYKAFTNIPVSTGVTVANANGTINENKLQATYQVYVAGGQEAGTYTGAVEYTLSEGNA